MIGRNRRLMFAGAILLLAVPLARRLAEPFRVVGADGLSNYRSRRVLLAETEALLTSLPTLEDSARTLRSRIAALAPRILNGHTPAEAVADLSDRLSLLATRQGSQLETVRAVPDTVGSSGLARVGVVVTMHTDAPGLARWLGAIATHPATLVVQRLRVGAAGGFGTQSEMESLQVETTVTGWYLPRVAKS